MTVNEGAAINCEDSAWPKPSFMTCQKSINLHLLGPIKRKLPPLKADP